MVLGQRVSVVRGAEFGGAFRHWCLYSAGCLGMRGHGRGFSFYAGRGACPVSGGQRPRQRLVPVFYPHSEQRHSGESRQITPLASDPALPVLCPRDVGNPKKGKLIRSREDAALLGPEARTRVDPRMAISARRGFPRPPPATPASSGASHASGLCKPVPECLASAVRRAGRVPCRLGKGFDGAVSSQASESARARRARAHLPRVRLLHRRDPPAV